MGQVQVIHLKNVKRTRSTRKRLERTRKKSRRTVRALVLRIRHSSVKSQDRSYHYALLILLQVLAILTASQQKMAISGSESQKPVAEVEAGAGDTVVDEVVGDMMASVVAGDEVAVKLIVTARLLRLHRMCARLALHDRSIG